MFTINNKFWLLSFYIKKTWTSNVQFLAWQVDPTKSANVSLNVIQKLLDFIIISRPIACLFSDCKCDLLSNEIQGTDTFLEELDTSFLILQRMTQSTPIFDCGFLITDWLVGSLKFSHNLLKNFFILEH